MAETYELIDPGVDGHADYRTTNIYADYAPDPSQGAAYAPKAFGRLSRDNPRTLEQAIHSGLPAGTEIR